MVIAESQVTGIISALKDLESSIDSLDVTVTDMKRQMSSLVQKEIDRLYEKTRAMATTEAEQIVEEAKKSADERAAKITNDTKDTLEKLHKDIDAGFKDAVDVAVDVIMKPSLQ